MLLATDPAPHLFWITGRAAGTLALVLASLAASLGLLMALRVRAGRGPDLRIAHEVLAVSTIVAIAVHGISLIGDQYLHPSVLDISIPFAGSYKSFWTSLGIISGWALIVLGLAYYARRRIGMERFRRLHRFTALAWVMGLAHALGEGTDAGQLWFLTMIGLVAAPALTLLVLRRLRGRASSYVVPTRSTAGS